MFQHPKASSTHSKYQIESYAGLMKNKKPIPFATNKTTKSRTK